MKVIAEKSIIDVPEEMILQEKNRRIEEMKKEAEQYKLNIETLVSFYGMTYEQYEARVTLEAAQYVRYNLIIEKIIEVEGFTATEEEFNNKVTQLATQYGVTEDKVRQFIPAESINFDVNYQKALDLIVKSAKLN